MLGGWVAYLAAVPVAVAILALRLGRWRTLVALIALAHVAVLASVALFPLPVDARVIADGRTYAAQPESGGFLNLVPFATLRPVLSGRAAPSVREIAVLNTLVLAPAGAYLPLLFPRLRRTSAFVPVALAVGASVETAQLAVSALLGYRYRSIDVDDVILNTMGVVIGYAALRLVLAATPRAHGHGAERPLGT